MLGGGWSNAPDQDQESDFNLISYIETHDVKTYDEFIDIIAEMAPESVESCDLQEAYITSFDICIDYESELVEVTIFSEAGTSRAYGTRNTASKSYYTKEGIKIFTVSIEGTFSYTSGSCSAIGSSGTFSKPASSTWLSTPNVSSGNITTRKAYVKISGVASNGSSSTSYSLTMTCDDAGQISSY